MLRYFRVLTLTVLSIVAVSCSREATLPSAASSLEGHVVPALTFSTADGGKVSLDALRGNVLLIDCWATWCPPCIASLPHIQKLADDSQRVGKGLKVLALNNVEDPADVAAFLKQNHYTFTVPIATQDDLQRLMVEGIPATFVVGRDGKILKTFVGYAGDLSDQELEKTVDAALAEPSTSTKA